MKSKSRWGCPTTGLDTDALNDFYTDPNTTTSAPVEQKRTRSWLVTSAETCLLRFNVSDRDVPTIEGNTSAKNIKAGVVFDRALPHVFPGLQRGDRLEPASKGYPDFWRGERIQDFPPG